MDCPICFNHYTATGAHVPKVFPCGHTICEACLGSLGSLPGDILECPLCRAVTAVADVSTNFALASALDHLAGTASALPAIPAIPAAPAIPPASAPPQSEIFVQPPMETRPAQQEMGLTQPLLDMAPSAPPLEPWEVGPQNMYTDADAQAWTFGRPETAMRMPQSENDEAFFTERERVLKDWGRKREQKMHRKPRCLMDQMISGSELYPPRLLDDTWFTPEELGKISQLEALLTGTGHAHSLARDMMTPLIYNTEVAIVLDDSGSMNLDMFGQPIRQYGNLAATSEFNPYLLQSTLRRSLPGGWFKATPNLQPAECPLSPNHSRWYFARHHLQSWQRIFSTLGMNPWLYLLNGAPKRRFLSEMDSLFNSRCSGSTPMSQTLRHVLRQLAPSSGKTKSLLILVLTDGEANDMQDFNRVLDEIQNLRYGDVQVCLMGLSLIKEDIEWFENEECDETRIRTIEPFEVENRQIQLREVTRREGGYTFDMHVMRALVTNYYPADYDYEAPLQNLFHRLYITIHGRDRWWGMQNPLWYGICSNGVCPVCFLATCCHCCGWLQGNDCGKWQAPECLQFE
eukprot:Skav202145  [mRNA]  locus=scaffold970:31859:33574:+ [translate_table: standard]